ncbi:hypothetical protein ILYODFUR_009054 [Ilyodon furcidens]|uniref:Uncharacterized protein n=1 Tax=Ilyodon furcidens TaxID=33524 RepID=A0ABV0SZ29_9TELE
MWNKLLKHYNSTICGLEKGGSCLKWWSSSITGVLITSSAIQEELERSPLRYLRHLFRSHREEAQGTLEGLCLSAGLGLPWAPPGRAGGGVWGEGRLGVFTQPAAFATQYWMKRKTTTTNMSLIEKCY